MVIPLTEIVFVEVSLLITVNIFPAVVTVGLKMVCAFPAPVKVIITPL
jgi:hypothetical protein